MKRFIKLFICLVLITIINIINSHESIIHGDEIDNPNEFINITPIDVPDYEKIVFITDDTYVYQDTKVYLSSIYGTIYICDYDLVNVKCKDDFIYVLVNDAINFCNYIYKIDSAYNVIDNVRIKDMKVLDMIIEDVIFLCGENNGDAYIALVDLEMYRCGDYYLAGDGIEEFTSMVFSNNRLYLSLYSEGISNNRIIPSFGKNNEHKSVLVIYDYVIDELEYNHYVDVSFGESEEYLKVSYINNLIYLHLISENKSFILTYDEENDSLNFVDSLTNTYCLFGLSNYKHKDLILNLYETATGVYLQEASYRYFLPSIKGVTSSFVYLGNLYLYSSNLNKLFKVSEYEVLISNTYKSSKDSFDINSTSHFSIKSFFEPLEFKYVSSSPKFLKQISGVYEVSYEALKLDGTKITHTTKNILEDYANFIDGGVYKSGKVLKFLGSATLDGVPVYNGHVINEEGMHKILITRCDNKVLEFNIYIVNDYYKDSNDEYTPSMILSNNDTYDYQIKLSNVENVLDVVVNDKKYHDFEYIDDVLHIYLHKISSVDTFLINSITYQNNGLNNTLDINERLNIKFIDSSMLLDIYRESSNNELLLNIKVTDPHQSFNYLKLTNTSDNSEVIVTDDFDLSILKTNNIKVSLVYNYGSKCECVDLCDYKTKDDFLKGKVNVSYDSGKINNIDITCTSPNGEVSAFGTVNEILEVKNKVPLLKIIIALSVVIILGSFIYVFIYKKRKLKKAL